MSERGIGGISIVIVVAMVLAIGFFGCTASGRAAWNAWFHDVQKADDNTRYATRRQVEDACRAMRANYRADAVTYRQYRAGAGDDHRAWADQAKARANRTAATYNEYVRKNSYVWRDNIPADIDSELPYLE